MPSGFDEADKYIVANLQAGDLIITSDIPLAAEVVERDAHAPSPKGEVYGIELIAQYQRLGGHNGALPSRTKARWRRQRSEQ